MAKKTMYQVVITSGDRERNISISINRREAELQLIRHIRSLAPGFAEIREISI